MAGRSLQKGGAPSPTVPECPPPGARLAPYRDEIARLFGEIDRRDATIRELRDEVARVRAWAAEEIARIRGEAGACALQSGVCAHAAEAVRLQDEVSRLNRKLAGQEGRVRRYENSTTPGMHGYNEERAAVRAAEERMLAAEEGRETDENHTIGPPPGHAGQRREVEPVRTIRHQYDRCPGCGNDCIKQRRFYSKVIADFEGDSRTITVTLHTGHAVRCDMCRRTFKPDFPSIEGTGFGITVLGYILEYAVKKNTDGDIAYYMDHLYGHPCAANTIWNARRAMAHILAPTVRAIVEELKKAPYLMIDETTYRYKKKKIYVWVVRTDTATLVVPAMGRGDIHMPEFLKQLSHIPVVVDGYSVYTGAFRIRQRCWAHILPRAEEAYIRCEDPARKKVHLELYHRLRNMHRKAKRIAEATAPAGGADAATCLRMERDVASIVAAYGDDGFATHLGNAMPHLFTFLRYPGLPSTNNATERDIRDDVVVQRRFRHHSATPAGMWVFSMLHSFASTCRKMRVAPGQMFERLATQPGFDAISYGLSVLRPKALPAPAPYGAGVESKSGPHVGSGSGPECTGAERDARDDTPDGTGPADDTSMTPPPAARPQARTIVAAVCVIWAWFQAGDAVRPHLPRPARDLHTALCMPGICSICTTPDDGQAAHRCGRPPPDYTI